MSQEMKTLREISEIMGSSLELNWVFERVMRVLAGDMGVEKSRLVILDPMTGKLRIETAHGLTAEQQGRGNYAIGEGVTG